MNLAFILTMPSRGSWNGAWSGEGNLYAVVRSFRKPPSNLSQLLGDHYYRWRDGWGANVEVIEVCGNESRRLKRQSKGFCGYEWMVDSLLTYGKICANHEIPETEKSV